MAKQLRMKSFLQLIMSLNIPKLGFVIGIAGSILTTMVGLTIPLLTREIVDGFSLASLSIGIIFVIVAAFLLHAIIDGFSTYLLAAVGQRIVARLRERLWLKIIRLPVRYFDKRTSGESVSRVINDTGIVKDLISQHFPQFISGLISIIGAVIILFVMDWKMTTIMFVSVPLTIAVMIPLGRQMSKISRGLQDETANFSGTIQQTIGEIRLMKSSTAEGMEKKKGITGIDRLLSFGLKEARIIALIGPFMYLIVMIVIVVIIGYGGIRVAEGSMSTGSLVAFLLYLFQIVFPITSFAMFFTALQKAKGATERIITTLQMEEESELPGLEIDITNMPIHFNNVTFRYDEENVLENISFKANPGEKIAFVGPSGAGKTTLFSLLERYYKPVAGEIYVGSHSIQDLSLFSWRKQIGYVSQESAMMSGTIRENLTYGLRNAEEIPDHQIWKVAKMAYIDEYIRSLEQGLETEVGERGVNLSGGQRQRINIARAFLRDPKILMLDEATASLDSQSEGMVQQALTHLMKGRTTFVIAHRLSTIVDADKIIFLDQGKITGIGTHDELMNSHTLYQEFAEKQLT